VISAIYTWLSGGKMNSNCERKTNGNTQKEAPWRESQPGTS
jgi:hypothetical protein